MFTYNEVFWLNVTNLVLGVATVVCLLVIGYVAFKEIRGRAKSRERATEEVDDHAFMIDGLGVTMADGGQKIGGDEMLVVTEDGIESLPAGNA